MLEELLASFGVAVAVAVAVALAVLVLFVVGAGAAGAITSAFDMFRFYDRHSCQLFHSIIERCFCCHLTITYGMLLGTERVFDLLLRNSSSTTVRNIVLPELMLVRCIG